MINTTKYNQARITEMQDDKRQLLIVRQSQLERAIEYYNLMGIQPDPLTLVSTAELFKNFVFDGLSPDVITRCKSLDEKVIQRKKKGVSEDEYPLVINK